MENQNNEKNVNEEQENNDMNQNNVELPVEADYYLIKNEPNEMWEKYEEKIKKVTISIGFYKSFDKDELYQQAYLYFVDFCKNYDPYYNGNFIPFDKYMFKNLIIKLRAYIQSYYFKRKREQPAEFSEYLMGASKDHLSIDDRMLVDQIYDLISDRQSQIIQLSMNGYKQHEIGDMLDISQSRVSVIRKKTLKKLKEKLENEN